MDLSKMKYSDILKLRGAKSDKPVKKLLKTVHSQVQDSLRTEQEERFWAMLDSDDERCMCDKCNTQVHSVRYILQRELNLASLEHGRSLSDWEKLGHTNGWVIPVADAKDGLLFRYMCSTCYEDWLVPLTKVCKMCDHELPSSSFHRHPKTKDRRQPYCIECMKLVVEKYKKIKNTLACTTHISS